MFREEIPRKDKEAPLYSAQRQAKVRAAIEQATREFLKTGKVEFVKDLRSPVVTEQMKKDRREKKGVWADTVSHKKG